MLRKAWHYAVNCEVKESHEKLEKSIEEINKSIRRLNKAGGKLSKQKAIGLTLLHPVLENSFQKLNLRARIEPSARKPILNFFKDSPQKSSFNLIDFDSVSNFVSIVRRSKRDSIGESADNFSISGGAEKSFDNSYDAKNNFFESFDSLTDIGPDALDLLDLVPLLASVRSIGKISQLNERKEAIEKSTSKAKQKKKEINRLKKRCSAFKSTLRSAESDLYYWCLIIEVASNDLLSKNKNFKEMATKGLIDAFKKWRREFNKPIPYS